MVIVWVGTAVLWHGGEVTGAQLDGDLHNRLEFGLETWRLVAPYAYARFCEVSARALGY